MTTTDVDVLCVGHSSYDLIFQVDHHPNGDEKMLASSFNQCGGGPAANAAITVARLGGKSAFAGYLGNDTFGAQNLEEFVDNNVATDFIIRGNSPTPLSTILVKPDGARSVVNYRKDTVPIQEIGKDLYFLKPKIILFDGHQPDLAKLIFDYAKEKSIPTLLDAGSVHSGTIQLAPMVDYLICSEKFGLNFSHQKEPAIAAEKLYRYSPHVVITRGENGLVWKTEKSAGMLPAFPINAEDTTGAGDVFHGTLAFCLAQKMVWHEALLFSSAAAAICCTKIGARKGIPSKSEVDNFLNSRP